jgi:hypothetical protein
MEIALTDPSLGAFARLFLPLHIYTLSLFGILSLSTKHTPIAIPNERPCSMKILRLRMKDAHLETICADRPLSIASPTRG